MEGERIGEKGRRAGRRCCGMHSAMLSKALLLTSDLLTCLSHTALMWLECLRTQVPAPGVPRDWAPPLIPGFQSKK